MTGGATQSAVVTAVLASTVITAKAGTKGRATTGAEPLSEWVLSGTQCFSHNTDWLCICSGESGACMEMLCAIAVVSTGGCILH